MAPAPRRLLADEAAGAALDEGAQALGGVLRVHQRARLLEEGIAQRASDIDMVYLTGYGFPLHRGGPMLYADQVGLYNVARAMHGFKAASGDSFWEPAPLLAKLAAEGKTFN